MAGSDLVRKGVAWQVGSGADGLGGASQGLAGVGRSGTEW